MASIASIELKLKASELSTGNVTNVLVSVYDYNKSGIQLYDDLTYNLNFQTFDISNLEKRASTYSKTLKIPGTSVNNHIFSNLFDIDIDVISNTSLPNLNENVFFGKKIECELLYDTYPIKEGFFELNKVYYNHSLRQIEYEGQFYSKSKSFAEDVGDKLLKGNENVEDDLNFSFYNHYLSPDSILNSHSGTYFDESRGYYYPIIDYVNKSDGNTMKIEDLRPSLYVKEIIDKIFQKVGYSYQSTFFESDYYKKLIIPWAGQVKGDEEDLDKKNMFIGMEDYDQTYTDFTGNGAKIYGDGTAFSYRDFYCDSPYQYGNDGTKAAWVETTEMSKLVPLNKDDLDPYYNSDEDDFDLVNHHFTVNSKSRYNIKWSPGVQIYLRHLLSGTPSFGDQIFFSTGDKKMEVKSQLYVDKGDGILQLLKEVKQLYSLPSKLPPSDAASFIGPFIINLEWEGLLESGWKVYPHVYIKQYNHWTNLSGQLGNYVRAWADVKSYTGPADFPSSFKVTAVDNYFLYEGQMVDMNKSLPSDVKQIDFFKEIINMFNLVIDEVPNEDKKLLIETRNDYYLSGETFDWSKKVDISRPEEIRRIDTLINKDFKLNYKNEKDDFNTLYQDAHRGKVYGNKTVKNPYLSIDTYNIDVSFSPTPLSNLGNTNWAVSKIFATDSNGELKEEDFNIRILFRDNLDAESQPTEQGHLSPVFIHTSGKTMFFGHSPYYYYETNYQPYAGHLDNPYNPTYDLNFDVCKSYYYSFNYSGMTPNNVYQNYWSDYIAELMDLNSKTVTKWIKLDITDIYNFQFNSKIWIDGVMYIIEKIYDWNPGQITKVDLLKLSKYDLDTTPKEYNLYIEPRITKPPSLKQKQKSRVLEIRPAYNRDYMTYNTGGTIGTVSGGTYVLSLTGTTLEPPVNRNNIYPESAYGLIIGEGNVVELNDNIFINGVNNKISKNVSNVSIFGSNNEIEEYVKDITVTGNNNIVKSGATNISINGNDLIINNNVKNVTVLSNSFTGVTITESDFVYLPDEFSIENVYNKQEVESFSESALEDANIYTDQKSGETLTFLSTNYYDRGEVDDLIIAGSSGTSGIDGTSGVDGTSGTSGVDGSSGTSGVDGSIGVDGTSGTDGTSGIDGSSGTSGVDGSSGTSGVDGSIGVDGTSGTDGTSGIDGSSGVDGNFYGSSGTSGIDGSSGVDGNFYGSSGTSGTSGSSGSDGTSGTSGISGTDGTSGSSGTSGTSGTSGVDGNFYGSSGTSGTSGSSGTSGTSGTDGTSGSSGLSPTGITSDSNFYYEDDILHVPSLSITTSGTTYLTLYDVVDGSQYNVYISGGTWGFSAV